MGVTVAEGVVVISADADAIPGDIASAVNRGQGLIGNSGDRAGRGWVDSFKGSFLGNALASVAVGAVTQIGEIIGTGIRAAWDFGWQSIDVASGLNEADTALEQVFGSSKGQIDKFAQGAARGLGQSELAAKKAAQNFGIYGKNAGLADDANATFSEGLVTLASDFASFYDTSPEQAIEAIGAALRGESEPIRTYGVLLDDATLKARAMSMGLLDTSVDMTKVEGAQLKVESAQKKVNDAVGKYGEDSLPARQAMQDLKEAQEKLGDEMAGVTDTALTPQQKILAAHAEILEQADTASGDFSRTSEGLANQQRILAAQFEDSKGKLGEALLPVMNDLVTFANDEFMPAFSDMIEKVGPELGDALIDAMPSIGELLDAFVDLLPQITDLAIEALPLFIEVLKLTIPVLQFLTENSSYWYGILNDVFGLIKGDTSLGELYDNIDETGGIIKWLVDIFSGFFGTLRTAIDWVKRTTGSVQGFKNGMSDLGNAAMDMAAQVGIGVGRAGEYVAGLPVKIGFAVMGAGTWLYSSGRALIQGFINGIQSMIASVGFAISNVVAGALDYFPNSPAKKGPLSGAGWTNLEKSGGAVIDQWARGMRGAAPAVPFDLMGIAAPRGGGAVRSTVASDAHNPGASSPSRRTDRPIVNVNQKITHSDPIIAGRQGARAVTEYLGV